MPASHWDPDGGLGQLTALGKRQLRNQGRHFRRHYSASLGLNASLTLATSTDYNRTLASVASFLGGLFPDEPPPPISTAPRLSDHVLFAKRACPRYQQLRAEVRTSVHYKRLEHAQAGFLTNMSRLSGLAHLDYYHMWEIADHLLVNEAHALPVPAWLEENRRQIEAANDYTFASDFATREMGKLVAGGLLNDVVEAMRRRVLGVSHTQLLVYGVHDNYLAGLQRLLDTSREFVNPNFGASYVLELRRDCDCGYYVSVAYKNDASLREVSFRPVNMGGKRER